MDKRKIILSIIFVTIGVIFLVLGFVLMLRSCTDQPSGTSVPPVSPVSEETTISTDEQVCIVPSTVPASDPTNPPTTLTSVTEPDQVTLEGISILNAPDKVVYKVGELFDSSGLVLLGTYSDGVDRMIRVGFECTPGVFSKEGEQFVTVAYQDKFVRISVQVVEAELDRITVRTLPERVIYFVGESLDVSGLTLTAKDSSGAEQIISSGFVCTPMNFDIVGNVSVTVQYGGMVTAFDVQVMEPAVTDVEVLTLPQKLVYHEGEQLNPAGLSLLVTYSDGTQKTITDGFVLSPMRLTVPGTQQITVYYEGLSTTLSVQVDQAAVASGSCGADLSWTLTDGNTLVISGTGKMDDYSGTKVVPWASQGADIQQVVISEDVRDISPGAFADCSALTGVTVSPENGYYMSDDFGALYTKDHQSLLLLPRNISDTVVLPDGLLRIEAFAMMECGFSNLMIPDSVEYIGANAVRNNLDLVAVTLGSGVKEIGAGAFANCPAMESLFIESAECVIFDQQNTLGDPNLTVIYGVSGSSVQTYAEKYGYTFLPI